MCVIAIKIVTFIKIICVFSADIKMSGDVADSMDARNALSQVETGKGLLFWEMKQESTWWEGIVGNFETMLHLFSFGHVAHQTPKLSPKKWKNCLQM